ncbi:MAG: TIGR01777 family oxidoreductase [Bacteroidales bacterium]|nr:TIGR01777 family oxidoreductase [Bacteroidales bacterium]
MRILLIGATGFIGRHLYDKLVERGHQLYVFTRNEKRAREILKGDAQIVQWRSNEHIVLQEYAHKVDAVVNLGGENLAAKPWRSEQKRKILSSRVNIGKAISFALNRSHDKPYLLIQGSAIGYYGFHPSYTFREGMPCGEGFLPIVTQQWEDSVRNVDDRNTRKVFIRTGLVLGKEGGLLPRMMQTFRFFAGGHLGSGEQWLSWIHIDDQVRAIVELLEADNSSGVYNLTSPHPAKMKDFASTLGKVMGRPSWFHVPGFVLKAIFGDMARETMLQGQKVLPGRLEDRGFEFSHPDLEEALYDLVHRTNR